MCDTLGRGLPKGNASNWGAGFLPGVFQGTYLSPKGDPIANLTRLGHMTDDDQRRQLALLARLNHRHEEQNPAEAELAARIRKLRAGLSHADRRLPKRSTSTRSRQRSKSCTASIARSADHFAKQALLARRLVERGVRFVQIFSGGMENQLSWDGHVDIAGNHRQFAGETDQPIARPADRSEAARPVGFDAGRSAPASSAGCRSRSRATSRDATTIPTPLPPGLPAAASKAARITARPTRSASRPRSIASASTICTPRSCTCWAWITRS